MTHKLVQEFMFWGIWLIIPLLLEVCSGILSAVVLVFKKYYLSNKKRVFDGIRVSVLIPVYKSEKTLEMCLESITKQAYPLKNIEVLLLNNGPIDKSYDIYQDFQKKHPNLKIWWYDTKQGKSKALNHGIYNSTGQYIINIDSDGWLDKNAIKNIVRKFESNKKIISLTGVILIDVDLIEETENRFLKTIQRCELFEYVESFLIGRNYQSVFNTMYTLAGACSAFRREALIKTNLYHYVTVGEDTHMTFQLRDLIGGHIVLCENAFFYVDPIEGINRLYSQRQRWQRGQLEVGKLFLDFHLGGFKELKQKFSLRLLISDHTLSFPRMIWIFGMIYMYFIEYPFKLLFGANVLLYLFYVFNGMVFYLVALLFLDDQVQMKGYITRHCYAVFLLPIYRFTVYWMRMAGMINSITTESNWSSKSLTKELEIMGSEVKNINRQWIKPAYIKMRGRILDE